MSTPRGGRILFVVFITFLPLLIGTRWDLRAERLDAWSPGIAVWSQDLVFQERTGTDGGDGITES